MTEQPELDRARGEAADVADCEVPLLQPANTDGEHRARPSSFRGSRLVWFIISLVCVFLLNICISQVEPFFPTVAHARYNATHTQVGFIIALMPLVVAFFSFAVTYLCRWIGHFAVLLGGLVLMAVSSVAFPLAPTLWAVAAIRIAQGVGAASVITPIMSTNTLLFPTHTNMVMGLVEAATGAGYLVGPVSGGILFHIGGYKMPFLITGAMTGLLAVAVLLVYITVREELAGVRQRAAASLLLRRASDGDNFVNPVIVLHSASIAIMSISYGFFGPVLGPEVKRTLHGTPLLTGMLFAVGAVAYCSGAPLGGLLSENITGNRRLISASFLLAALGLALMGPVPLLPWGSAGLQWAYKVSGMALVGIGVAFSVPLVPDMIAAEAGRPGGEDTVAALYASMYSVGEVVGPILGGMLTQRFGFPLASTMVAGLLVAWAMILVFLGSTGCLPWRGGPPKPEVFADLPGADALVRTWSNFSAAVSMSRVASAQVLDAAASEHEEAEAGDMAAAMAAVMAEEDAEESGGSAL